jgi:hypothetical protein
LSRIGYFDVHLGVTRRLRGEVANHHLGAGNALAGEKRESKKKGE